MISAEFSKNKPLADKVVFLKNHYGNDGKGFIFDERKVTAWWNNDGMRISYGSSTRDNFTQELSWEDVARRIDELLDVGRFAPTDVLIQIPKYLYNRTADRFWDMRRDMNFDEYPELNELFTDSVYNSTGSYPDNVSRIEAYLKTPKGLNDVNELMKKICELYDENTDIVRFRGLNNPHRVAQMVEDLYIPRKEYTAENLSYVPPVRFISEDEIDNIFRRGTGMQDGRYRVYNYFAEHPDKQERIAFLKKEYGTGGSYDGKRNEDHDGKGIRFSRGQLGNPLAEVHIKWNEAEKRIDKLIKQGRYLTEKDIKNIPDYERNEVAQAIYYAFHNRIQDGQYYALFNEVKKSDYTVNYTDLTKSYWAYADIAYAKHIGWLNGYADGTFKGDNNITRAEVVTVTNHATNRVPDEDYINKNVSTLNKFTDLKNNSHWAYYSIMEAANTHLGVANADAENWVK